MSLTGFISLPDVAARITPLQPRLPRLLGLALLVPPRSNRYALIGTAFDYLLRFELQRRAPHAISTRWVAEEAPDLICPPTDRLWAGMDLLAEAGPDDYLPADDAAALARRFIGDSRAAVAAYLNSPAPTDSQKADLAAHALRLAQLDPVYRKSTLKPGFDRVASEDVEELLGLLAVVPFDGLLNPDLLMLNPDFGAASRLVGDADADVIAGDLLVDLKVTKRGEVQDAHLDQLLGYLLLARRCAAQDVTFPVIHRLGIYFARHGHLWTQDAALWTEHPGFAEVERWFFERAQEEFQLVLARKV
jgi:hypothetical protein